MNSIRSLAALLCTVAGCLAVPTTFARAATDDGLGPAIRQALGGPWEARYFEASVDLNGDGRPEVVTLVAGPRVCGTGGCPLFVFARESAGYRLIARVSVVRPPVRLSPRSSHGWRNLVVGVGGGGMPAGDAELGFDGKRYPGNATVAPARPLPDLEGTEILIPHFQSYRNGKPVAGAQEVYGDPSTPVAGKVLGTVIHTADAEELRYVILKHLTDSYADAKGITVTQPDKDAYAAHMESVRRADRERNEARRDDLRRKLAARGLPEPERKKLTSELDALNQMLATLEGMEQEAARNPEETRAARDQIASAFIRQWKINQALYRQYGGRIIFQQGGPEPLDAYRRFLEERRSRGDFEILDQSLEAAFWRYYLTDSIHSFYPAGSDEEAKAFAVPWWLKK